MSAAMPRAAGALTLALALLLAPASAMRSQLPSAAQAAPRPPRSLLLPQFSLSELQSPDDVTRARLAEAVFDIGMFAVRAPGCAHATNPFMGSLQSYLECVDSDALAEEHLLTTHADDRTQRTTLAVSTNASVPSPLPAGVANACPAFAESAPKLRHAADATGAAYAALLDDLVHGRQAAADGTNADSYLDAVVRGESLEHFHVFRRDRAPDDDLATLSLHTDVGLFIVMTAPEYFSEPGAERLAPEAGKPASGFVLQLPSGELVKPVAPEGSLLVLNGEGATRWMRAVDGARRPRPATHEVTVPDIRGMARAWFGRMYFPPRDALLQADDAGNVITFGEFRRQTHAAFRDGTPELASTAGCSPARRLLQDVGSCARDDEVWCWHMCIQFTPDLAANCSMDEVRCAHKGNGKLWPEELTYPDGSPQHCRDCGLVCPAAQPAPDLCPSTDSSWEVDGVKHFCNGSLIVGGDGISCLGSQTCFSGELCEEAVACTAAAPGVLTYGAYLKGKNVVPPHVTRAWGYASVSMLNASHGVMYIDVYNVEGAYAAEVFNCSAGCNGESMMTIFDFGNLYVSGTFQTSLAFDPSADAGLAELISSGGAYVSVRTQMYPDGDIRGQLM